MSRKVDLYLLHFDAPVQGKMHYWGQCECGTIAKRMLVHASGRGSSMTSKAARTGIGWTIGAVRRNVDASEERRMKNRGHASAYCSVCDPPPFGEEDEMIGVHIQPVIPPQGKQYMCLGYTE